MEESFKGLSKAEVNHAFRTFGPNEIHEVKPVTIWDILIRQVKGNFIVYLLTFATIIAFLVGDGVTGVALVFDIFVLIFVSFLQEYRAEKVTASLRSLLVPVSTVVREGKEEQIPSREIVPGDILVLRSGERVPADASILSESNLAVNESILTGESREVEKKVWTEGVSESNETTIFAGSFLVGGRCVAKVIKTGMTTKFGGITRLITTAQKVLPLQEKVNKIAKVMTAVAIVASGATGLLILVRADSFTMATFSSILILIIALCVSAFPEGFPVVLVTTLAAGMNRMAKRNAIVNRMSVIETLGETTVICTDKTGTITKGEMTVQKVVLGKRVIEVGGIGYEVDGELMTGGRKVGVGDDPSFERLLRCTVLCNDTRIKKDEKGKLYEVLGTPTEGAILVAAAKAGVFREDIKSKRISEVPFSSERKMMSVLCQEGTRNVVYLKGALEKVLARSTFVEEVGKVVALDRSKKRKILTEAKKLGDEGNRLLGFAYKVLSPDKKNYDEDGLLFLGFMAMTDPPKEGVAEAVELAEKAGIAIKMITGDVKETAMAVAKEIGLSGEVVTGDELDALTDEQLRYNIGSFGIFARVRPEHKVRIVKALKKKGEIVTMTGDGVNDAPALKEAHIGVAMGISGTDVSRSVADLTLKDDNFATIVAAIKEGRTIFNNIRKFVSYQLSCNVSELMVLFFGVLLAPLVGWQVPVLLALQILFMNLVTDDLPAITLGLNRSSNDVMETPPRRKASILNKPLMGLVVFTGFVKASLVLGGLFVTVWIFHFGVDLARTTALVTLIFLELGGAFVFRSFRYKVLNRSVFVNGYLFVASLISIAATLFIVYTPASIIFKTVPLGIVSWVMILGEMFLFVALYDFLKEEWVRRGIVQKFMN